MSEARIAVGRKEPPGQMENEQREELERGEEGDRGGSVRERERTPQDEGERHDDRR
jgi:hypothetical protein